MTTHEPGLILASRLPARGRPYSMAFHTMSRTRGQSSGSSMEEALASLECEDATSPIRAFSGGAPRSDRAARPCADAAKKVLRLAVLISGSCASDEIGCAVGLEREHAMPWLTRQALEGFLVHFVAPAGFVGNRQVAVLGHNRLSLDQVFARRLVVRMVFQDDEVRRGGGEVNVHQRGQRTQRVVRRHLDVVRFGDGGNLLLLQYPAGQADIRLNDDGPAQGHQLLELVLGVQFLSRGAGDL